MKRSLLLCVLAAMVGLAALPSRAEVRRFTGRLVEIEEEHRDTGCAEAQVRLEGGVAETGVGCSGQPALPDASGASVHLIHPGSLSGDLPEAIEQPRGARRAVRPADVVIAVPF